MSRLDSAGTFRGEILEGSVSLTKKGFPQFVARLSVLEKYVDSVEEMAHFEIEEAGWVDWSSYGDEIVGFFVLFNDPENFIVEGPDKTSLLNYEQLCLATEWDGADFEALAGDGQAGKKVLFRVDFEEYQGKSDHKVNWIDKWDASPTRELKQLPTDQLKGLSSKIKGAKKTKPTAAKPAAAKPGAAKPAAKPAAAPPAKPAPAPKTEEVEAEETSTVSLPESMTKEEAWAFVCEHKGGNTDKDVEDAWIDACTEVGPDKDESEFTNEDWATVTALIVKDMALDV